MRDLFLLAVLPFLLYAMARRPFIGLGLWIWTALFFPNAWVYGLASPIRFNLLFAGVTAFSYLIMRNKPSFKLSGTGLLVLLFFAWTTASTIMALGRPELAWDLWERFLKVVLLFVFILAVVNNKLHVDFFLACVVLAIGFYADLEALKFIASGGGHKIEGMHGHVLGDRNELAVAFVMTIPLCVYLLQQYGQQSRALRAFLLGTIALTAVAVIGTQSRGGFIAMLALGAWFLVKSERKLLATATLAVLALGLSQVITSEWLSRIDTIDEANKDASFMGRVVAWKLSFILAAENPFFGAGFKGLEYFPVWSELSEKFHSFPWFYTGDALPDTEKARAAHSVYFQVLGDHGFVGFAIYLAMLLAAFAKARNIARLSRSQRLPEWIPRVTTALQLSLVVFCIGGAALSFAYFDLTFAIVALLIVIERRLVPAAIKEART